MSFKRKCHRAWARQQSSHGYGTMPRNNNDHPSPKSHDSVFRNSLVRTLISPAIAASLVLSSFNGVMAQDIAADGKTQTTIVVNGNVTDISTTTIQGQNAFNSLSYFIVDGGNIVNFYLPGSTSNLFNVVSTPVGINGIVNAIQSGSIGGNIYFITPGFVVGQSGVLNIGSLNVVTPTQDFINNFFVAPGIPSDTATIQVIDGQVPLDSNGYITVQGKINAIGNIELEGGYVTNSGTMTTGAVFMATRPDMSDVVNLNGLESGTKIAVVNGNIEIVAMNDIENSGTIAANGASNLNAGNISLTAGNDIILNSNSRISARGYGENSAGGNIRVYASDSASFKKDAVIDVRGGQISGDGGFAELSAANEVELGGGIFQAGAVSGSAGTVLIDPENLTISTNLTPGEGATDGIKWSSGHLILTADNKITVASGVTISTRVTSGDLLTGTSTGDSGDISLTAPTITIGANAKLLTQAINTSTSYSAGDITLSGKVITLNHGSQLLAYDNNGNNGGKITLEARDEATSGYAGAKTANASIQIGDDTGGAILRGGDIDIHAIAIAENGIILPDPNNLESTVMIATTLLEDVPSLLSDFTGSNVIYSSAEAAATITVKKGSVLEADNTIDLKAETLAEAGSKPFDIPALDLYVKTDVPLAVGILYANLDAHSTVTIEDNVTINASDLTINARNNVALDAAIAAEPPAATGTSKVSLAVGLSWTDVSATINVGGELNVSDSIQIAATNEGSYSTEVSAKSGTDGIAAGAVVLSFRDTSATANLTADVTDAATLGVYAVNNITEDVVDVSTKSGTSTLTDIVNKLEMNITDKVQGPIYKLLGLSSLNPSTQVSDPAQQQKFRVSGAIAYADHTDSAIATIRESARIHTTGSVAVASLVNAENTSISASSAAVSNSATDPSAGDTSQQSYAVGLAIGNYDRNSLATVGSNVTITASAIGISAKTSTPIRNYNVLSGFAFDEWSNVTNFVGAIEEVITSTEDIVGLLDMFNGQASAKAVSDESAGSVNISGSVGLFTYNNTSQAIIDSGAIINLTGTTTGSWTTDAIVLTEGVSAKTISIGGKDYTYKNAVDPKDITFSFEKQAQVKAKNDNTLLFMGGAIIPSSSGQVGLGGSFNMVTVNSDVNAMVREGAIIRGVTETGNTADAGSRTWTINSTRLAPEFEVSANNLDKVISLVAKSGYGATYGVNGTVVVTNVNQETFAWIDDEATIRTNNLTVNAKTTPLVWSISGQGSLGSGLNVGIGVAVNEITGDTRAMIADNDTVSTEKDTNGNEIARTSQRSISQYSPLNLNGAIIASPAIAVKAHTGGNIGSYAVTGTVVNYTDDKGGFFTNLKNGYKDLTAKAAGIVGLTQTTVAKNNQSIEQPAPPSFGISGAGSISINMASQQNTAKVDNVYISQSRPINFTSPSSLNIIGTADPTIVAATGSAAITRANSKNQSATAGISGSIAVNQVGNGNSSILSNSTVIEANDLNVQALSSGERVAVAIGAQVDASKGGGSTVSLALAGSVSLTLDEKDDEGNTKNLTSAVIEDTRITGAAGGTGRDIEVIAYNSGKVGTGGGSLELQPAKGTASGGGVGAAVTYADVNNDIFSRISGSTITSVDSIGVHAYNASVIGSGGATAAFTNNQNSLALAGTFLINEITSKTNATVEGSSLTAINSVTVDAKNKETDSVLEALIKPNGKSIDENLEYEALGELNGNSIVSVAGVVQLTKGTNVGFSINYNNISDNLTAKINDSTVSATGTAGKIDVNTESNASILGLAFGVGVSTNSLSGAGSVAIGEVHNTNNALVGESSTLTADHVSIKATDNSTIQTIAGQVNVALKQNSAVGAAVTYNEIGNNVNAQVNNSIIHGLSNVTVSGNNTSGIDSIAAAGTLATGQAAVSGSVTINFIENTTQSQIINGSTVDDGIGTSNVLTVSSVDSSTLQSLAGTLAVSKGQAGAGGAFAYNSIANANSALVDGSAINDAATLNLTATENATINTLSAAAAGGQKVGLSGSVSINQIGHAFDESDLADHRTISELKNSTVNGDTQITVTGSDTSEINSIAGAAAISTGGVSIGGAIAYNHIYGVAEGTVTNASLLNIEGLTISGTNSSGIRSIAASGSGGAKGAFAGSATANTIGSHTLAGITSSSITGSTADVAITADNTGTIEAISGAVGIAGTAGVGAAVAVNRIFNETDAFIDGSSSGGNYAVEDLLVKGISANTIKSAAVGIGGGGDVGVGGSTATNYIGSNTKSYITNGAVVVSQNNVGVIAQTDDVITNLAGSAGIGIATAGVGISVTVNKISGDTLAYIDGASTQVTALANDATDELTISNGKLTGSIDLAKGLDLGEYARTDLKGMRETEELNGVAVNSTATHSVENLVANVAGGAYAGVGGTTNTSLINGNTKAYINAAKINSSGTGSANQELSVIAGDHAYSNGFVGSLTGGLGGVGLGADTNVFNNTTQAYITGSPDINAVSGINVNAQSTQGASSLAVSFSGGAVAVVGTSSVGVFDSTTEAYLASSDVDAGSLKVNADHSSNFFTAVGGVTIGGGAVSASVAVVSDDSTSRAYIDGSTVRTTGAVDVNSQNTVNISNWSVSGAGAGQSAVAGSVAVNLINNTTEAYINNSVLGTSIKKTNNVSIHAGNILNIDSQAGALSVGLQGWGVGAGASVIEIGNTTSSYINNSDVYAAHAVNIDSQVERTIENTAVTLGVGGTVGISGSVAVTLIGKELDGSVNSSELDKGNTGTLTIVNDMTQSNRLSIENNDGVTQAITNEELNDLNNAGKFSTDSKLNSASLSYRTSALVTGDSTVTAHSVKLSADEKDDNSILVGGLAVGSVGIGGSVGVMDVKRNVDASILGTIDGNPQITTTGSINITAITDDLTTDPSLSVQSYQGSAGIVGLGVAVSVANLTGNVTASVDRGVNLRSNSGGIGIVADDNSSVSSDAYGFAAGWAAAGIVSANASKDGAINASIGDTASITGVTTSINSGSGGLSVESSRSGKVSASTLAGAGGVISGNGAAAIATEDGAVKAIIGNQVTLTAGGTVKVEAIAEPQTYAKQRGYGGALIAQVGVGIASATATPDVTAKIGTKSDIKAGSLTVNAVTRLNNGNDSAYSYAEAVGIGGYLNVGVNQSTAETESKVTAEIGDGTHLTITSGSTTVTASNTTQEKAEVSGISASLLAAAGSFAADANANSITNATIGNGVYGDAGTSLTVFANGSDTTFAKAKSGSGGLIAGAAAKATTHNGSATTATLGGGTTTQSLTADSMTVQGQHEANINSQTDSIKASVLGASGSIANNYTYAEGSNGDIGTVVTAQIAPDANLLTQSFEGKALNKTVKNNLSADNAYAGSGGFIDGAAAISNTEVYNYTHVVMGDRATIRVTGDTENPLLTNFDAINVINLYDKSHLDSGGAIAIAKAESLLKANLYADVTMGEDATIDSIGSVKMGTRNTSYLNANASSKTYGIAGAAQGESNASVNVNDKVTIGAGASIRADGDISLMAGRDSSGVANNLTSVAYTDLYNKTALPIETDPDADAVIQQTNNIIITAGAEIGSVANVNLITDKGITSASGQGIGKDLYRELLAEIGSALSNLFGGGDVSLDIHGGSNTNTAGSLVKIDGTVNAGIQHIQYLDIALGNTPNYSLNPLQPDEEIETIQIQVGSDASGHPIYQSLTLRRTPGVNYTISTENLQSNLVTRINALQVLLGQYSGNANTQAALIAEIDFLKQKLAEMFPEGSDQSTVVAQINNVPLITVGDVLARSGNININADSLTGSGALDAPGDVKISIINRGQAYLRTSQLTIPEDSGGYIYFNGVAVSDRSEITDRNKSGSFNGNIIAAENSPVPEITVLNTYVPNSSDALAPDIEVSGDISNLRGIVTISSTSGSVNIESADPSQPLTAPNIAAGTIKISAGKDFVYNNPNSWYNVGGDPRSIWGGLRDSNGNAVPGVGGSKTADDLEDTYENYALAASTTGMPASYQHSVATGRNGQGSAIAGNNIFISARYLNINGLIKSGVQDFEITIPNATALTNEINSYQTDYNAKVAAGNPPADPTYPLNNTSGNITAFYNAKTREIELQPVRSQGGTIQLVGEILNTGGGSIETMDGYSKITVTNNSNYNVVEHGLDTGGNGINGKIVITDFAKQFVATNSAGQTVTVPITTTYTRKNGTVHVEQTAIVYNPNGTSTQYIVKADENTGSIRGTDGKVSYAPDEGERFMWVTGSTVGTSDKWVVNHTTGGWFFSWSSDDSYSGEHTQISTGTHPIPSNGYEMFTPSDAQRDAWGSQSGAYEYNGTFVSTGVNEWDVYRNWSSGFLGYYKHHERTHYRITGGQIYNLNSVKGDYAIPIRFNGYDQGIVSITSSAGIVLDGTINNATGSVVLTATGAIASTSSQAAIISPKITMTAGTGIGNGDGNVPVYFNLTGNPHSITALSTKGDINLQSIQGIVNVNKIATGYGGNVSLTADGSIVQAAPGDAAVITGHIINLTSMSGEIGTASQSLNIQVVPSSTDDLTAGLSATATGDIYLRQPENDFPLISINSSGGNVFIEAADGDLINANPYEDPDTRNQEQLIKLWENNQLIAGKGAELSAENTLTAYQNMMAELYREYWLNARHLRIEQDSSSASGRKYVADVYNPNYLVPLSEALASRLKALKGWTDEQLQVFRQQLTEDFGTGDYNPNYVYTIPTAGSNVISKSDLTAGYSWSENQLKTGITALYFKQTSDTQTVIPESNITAPNGNVTLKAVNGSVGTDTTPIVIRGADLENPTEQQRLALAAAEAVDIEVDNDPINPSVTVLQRRAINVETAGVIAIEAQDHVYLGSQTDLRIKSTVAGESIRIKGQGSIFDVSIGGQGALQGGGTQGVILEAAKGSIGTADNPLTMALNPGTPLTARAGQGIYIHELLGDINVAYMYTPMFINVEAAGSILNAANPVNALTIQGNGMNLTATVGSIGAVNNPLKLVVGPDANAELNAFAGQGVYLGVPSKVGSTVFPNLNIGQVDAGGSVVINADGNINAQGITAASSIGINAGGNIDINEATSAGSSVVIDAGGNINAQDMIAASSIEMNAGGNIDINEATSAGSSVVIDAGGNISVQDITAASSIEMNAGGNIDINEATSAGSSVVIDAGGNINAQDITAASSIGINAAGNIGINEATSAGSSVVIDAGGNITAQDIIAVSSIGIKAGGNIGINETTSAGSSVVIDAGGNINAQDITAASSVEINAGGNIGFNTITTEASVGINAGGNISVRTIMAVTGDIVLSAQGSILNRLRNDEINLTTNNINLVANDGQIGEFDAHLVVYSSGTVNAAAAGDIYLDERNGDLISDTIISQDGVVDLTITNGSVSINNISGRQLNLSLTAVGTSVNLGNITVAEGIGVFADNVQLGNLVHTGTSLLKVSIGGGSKEMADNVIVNATSDIGIVFDMLHADYAQINAQTDGLTLLNTIIGHRAEISNTYYKVLANNDYNGLEDFDAQLYPEDRTFYLAIGTERLIFTDAYIVDYDPEFILNEANIRNSFVRQGEMDLPIWINPAGLQWTNSLISNGLDNDFESVIYDPNRLGIEENPKNDQ